MTRTLPQPRRRSVAEIALIAALFALVVGPVRAGSIQGVVTDRDTHEPLRFVSVSIESAEGQDGTITTAAGEYRFANLAAGSYLLRFTYIGYATQEELLVVSATASVRLPIALIPAAIPMEEVMVTGDRVASERAFQTGYVELGRRELMSVPAMGEPDPVRTLQFMPGVQAASDVSSGLYVRGGGPDQTLILLDRVALYNPTHAFGLFSTFNSDAIERTTLYKGAYPAEYGGRLGAVLDVRNREGDPTRLRGKASLSTISGRLHLEGPFDKAGSWMLGVRRTYLEPILNAMRNGGQNVPSYYFYDVNGKVRLTAPGDDRLVMTGYAGRDAMRFDLDTDSYLDINWGNTAVSAVYTHSFSPSLLGHMALSGSEYLSDMEVRIFSTPFSFSNQVQDITMRSDLIWDAGSAHTVRGGIAASLYEFDFSQTLNGDLAVNIGSRPTELAAFVQDEWRPASRTNVRLGVRARHFSEGNRDFVEPRLGITQGLGRFRLKVGAGVYHQVLQLVSTEGFSAGDFYVATDETADPSRSYHAVLGLDWDISRRYHGSIEAYHTELENLVMLDQTGTPDMAQATTADIFLTGGRGSARGVELFLERRTGSVTGWIGYTLGRTTRRFDELNAGKAFAPKYDRRHDVNVVASYRRGPWSLGGAFVYGTGQAFTPAQSRYDIRNPATDTSPASGMLLPAERNSARLLPYHRLDVNISRRMSLFGRPGEWFIQVFNLYSRKNEWFVEYDSSNPETEPTVVTQLPVIPSFGFSLDF